MTALAHIPYLNFNFTVMGIEPIPLKLMLGIQTNYNILLSKIDMPIINRYYYVAPVTATTQQIQCVITISNRYLCEHPS
jgi:hypothetical protein